ncbi:hypothetical protein EV421DRAFT_1829530 [Armillaria borealis]|uniref:Uncharacterized protein n=1 Tax=Armillaria borealis TaxID=47425 RepID=A0AA39J8A9_9AGAR|nr:hypothetical protein EV421DRAFT_1829530 [Armillaria borealis]
MDRLGLTLYKVKADTFLTQSWPLKKEIDRSVPNYEGSSDDNPFRLNTKIIEQDDFDALIEFYYNPATANTREKCLSILLACFALTLLETETTVQAILETIDSSSGTSLSSTILPVGGLNLPVAGVNAANMKADKLLAKYQKRLRDLNNMQAARKERLDQLRKVQKMPINLKDVFEEAFGKDSELRKRILQSECQRSVTS